MMDSAQKRQKSWFGSITSLVGGGRSSSTLDSPAPASTTKSTAAVTNTMTTSSFKSRSRAPLSIEKTPSRPRNTFSAPSPDSPESPAKRASPSILAQRKILDRPQGPSAKLSANPPKITNFAATTATTPRNIFRSTMAKDTPPAFTFTPRVPPNTLRAAFPPETPGRSYRASTTELSGRGMSKTAASSDLFNMKIPEPDPQLTGEVIAKQVPVDATRAGSIYASEFLAHLCPAGFNETQRNQFFCILDLRRLKYAADEIFLKKDWKLNILNFAKEYEKSRSLIMLRYGLYEFKTVKVSKEVFQKWKEANNVPDEPVEEGPIAPKPKVNGTRGILGQGKRKAQDDLQPSAAAAVHSTPAAAASKRARTTEVREPLAETTTPALNSSKRKATVRDDSGDNPPSKLQRKTPQPSATKAFFEKVANAPLKDTPTAQPQPAQISKPAAEATPSSKPKLGAFAPVPASKPAQSNLARSVLDGGLKPGSAQANIFGYLSDASSAKGSGNENADADAEDTSEEEESETQEVSQSDEPSVAASGGVATPQPGAALFSVSKPAIAAADSSTSSEVSDVGSGRSLLDRISKDQNGQPIRRLPQDAAAPQFGAKAPPSERAASPERQQQPAATPANKTWTTDTPIKFAGGAAAAAAQQPSSSIFAANTPKPGTSLFAPKDATAPSTSFGLEPSTTPAPAKPATSAPAAGEAGKATPGKPLFGFLNKSSELGTSSATAPTPLFGQTKSEPAKVAEPASAAPAASKMNMFAAQAQDAASKSGPKSVLQSQTLFGNPVTPSETATSQPQAAKPLFGASALVQDKDKAPAGSLFASAPKTGGLFGSSTAPAAAAAAASGNDQSAAKPLFGASTTQPSSNIFGAASSKPNGLAEGQAATTAAVSKPLFGSTSATAAGQDQKPLFGSAPATSADAPKTQPATGLFGSTAAPATSAAAPIFSFGAAQSAPAPSLSFGSTAPESAPAPMFGGAGGTTTPGSSFTFQAGPAGEQSFHNPFSTGGDSSSGAGSSFTFGAPTGAPAAAAAGSSPFQFGAGSAVAAPAPAPAASGSLFQFGGTTPQPASTPGPSSNLFGGAANGGALGGSSFSFGGAAAQPAGSLALSQPKLGQSSLFNLAPPMGGTSTGTNTPFTFGGASSLATTPATGTPEPVATQDHGDNDGQQADGDERPQEQINLTEGGPGEEDETVVYEVRTKALKLVNSKDSSDDESSAAKDKTDKKSPWKTMGVGPLRMLKHKTTGAVRLLLRAEPRGHVALNKALLPNFNYKPETGGPYVKLTVSADSGTGLETWMLQVKKKDVAQALADALEAHKGGNKT